MNRPGAWGPGGRELRERRGRELVFARGGRTGSRRGYSLRHRRCSGRRRVSEIDACCEAIAAACSARVAPVSCRIFWQTTCLGGCRRILTGRTPTRSSSRPTPSPACARRASCATSETTPKTFLSRWPKWTSSYRDWDGPAPGAHPLLDQVQRKASGHLSLSGLRIPWPMGRGKPSVDSADRPAFRKQTLSAARWQCESCPASEPRVRDSRIGRRASVIRARRLRRGGTRARRPVRERGDSCSSCSQRQGFRQPHRWLTRRPDPTLNRDPHCDVSDVDSRHRYLPGPSGHARRGDRG